MLTYPTRREDEVRLKRSAYYDQKFFLRVAKGYKLRTYMIRFDPKEISLVKDKIIYILTAKTGAVKISLVKEEQPRVPSSINYH
jgi:hypothetical protein